MTDRVESFAEALLTVARAEGQTDRVEDELFRFARAFEANEDLRRTLTDAAVPADRRQGIVEDLMGAKSHPLSVSMASFVVGAGRARELPDIVDSFVSRAAELRAEAVAEVRSAIPLDTDQQSRLAESLGRATGKRVTVKVIVDPSVLGGLVARVGDTVIDGSVRSRLDQMKEVL